MSKNSTNDYKAQVQEARQTAREDANFAAQHGITKDAALAEIREIKTIVKPLLAKLTKEQQQELATRMGLTGASLDVYPTLIALYRLRNELCAGGFADLDADALIANAY